MTIDLRLLGLGCACLAAGCNLLVDLKDPRLRSDDGGISDAATQDSSAAGPVDATDPVTDSGVPDGPRLWLFTTNGIFDGGFGAVNGGRSAADARCDSMYQFAFTSRQCSHVHAVIQVDNNTDTLLNMATTFQIPSGIPAARATDGVKLADQWGDVINKNVALQAPLSTATGTNVYFWSGRGPTVGRQCSTWTSSDSGFLGDAGDATMTSGWMTQMAFSCNTQAPHLLCVCW